MKSYFLFKESKAEKQLTTLFVLILISSFSILSAQVQKEQKPPLRERLFFGGTLGLQFGTYTNIQVTPIVGLWVRPRIAIAAGPNFQYYKDPYFKTTIYGGNGYIQLVPLRDLNNIVPIGLHMGFFLQLEDELLSLESSVFDPQNPSNRFTINTVLAGCGISQSLGGRAAMNLMFLWALNNYSYGLYSNPEIRLSFSF